MSNYQPLRAGLLSFTILLAAITGVKMSASVTAKLQDDMNSIPLADDDPQGTKMLFPYLF